MSSTEGRVDEISKDESRRSELKPSRSSAEGMDSEKPRKCEFVGAGEWASGAAMAGLVQSA